MAVAVGDIVDTLWCAAKKYLGPEKCLVIKVDEISEVRWKMACMHLLELGSVSRECHIMLSA